MSQSEQIVRGLDCWSGKIGLRQLEGGISNENFFVEDGARKFVVRVNGDIPEHGVLRINDANCNRAASAVGVAPAVYHAASNALVVDFIDGRTYEAADVRDPENLRRIVSLVKRTHASALKQLRGPVCAFWPFRICRDYAAFLNEHKSWAAPRLPRLLDANARLERITGAITPVLGHNDLLAANMIDDGKRLWLIDWEHAGLTSPLFDLANLATNNDLDAEQQSWLLETYFEDMVDTDMQLRFKAMKSVSLLREAMWSMVSEITSRVDFDYRTYSVEYLDRFNSEFSNIQKGRGL